MKTVAATFMFLASTGLTENPRLVFDPTAVNGAYRGTERREQRDCICVYYVSVCVFADANDRLQLGPSSLRLFTDRVLIDSEIFAVYICSATQTSIKRRPSSTLLLCQ